MAELEIVARAIDNATSVLKGVERSIGDLNRNLPSLKTQLDHANSAAGGMGRSLSGMGDAAKRSHGLLQGVISTAAGFGVAQIGLGLVGGAASQLKDALFGLNTEAENVKAQLMAFTKDGAKAEAILADIRAEADKTPFSFQAMSKATAGLMSSAKMANEPLMDLVKTAEILAAANPEQGLEGAAFALREAVSGDFTSVIERFNLPRSYINKLKDEGVPALEAVRRAMLEMGYDSDLVANLAKTATGRWSTLMDTFDGIKVKLSKPLFEKLKEGLEAVQKILDDNKPLIDSWVTAIGDGLVQAVSDAEVYLGLLADKAKPLIEQALPMLGQAAAFVGEHIDEFKGALIAIGAVLAGAAIVGGIATVVALIASLASPIGLIVAAVALLGAAWAGNWGDIQGKTQAVIGFIDRLFKTVGAAWSNFWEIHGDRIETAWRMVWGAIQFLVEGYLTYIGALFAAFSAAFRGDWEEFGRKLREAWDAAWQLVIGIMKGALSILADLAIQLARAVWGAIVNTDWAAVGRSIVDGFINGIYQRWDSFMSVIRALADAAWGTIKGFFGIDSPSKLMIQAGKHVVEGFALGIQRNEQLPRVAMQAVAMQTAGSSGITNTYSYNQPQTVLVQDRAAAAMIIESSRNQRIRRLAEAF